MARMMEGSDSLFGDSDEEDGDEVRVCEFDLTLSETRKTLLAQRPVDCGVLAFHSGTEEALFLFVQRNATRGDAASVLKSIDVFCYSRHWMMHCGDRKLPTLDSALQMARERAPSGPFLCVEVGCYCGYSAVKIASTFSSGSRESLVCIEKEPKCAMWTERMVEFAGLGDKVKVVVGTVTPDFLAGTLTPLLETAGKSAIDMLFLDHDKASYLEDLLTFERSGLLLSGAVVMADNVLSFGQPLDDYLAHVRSCSFFTSSILLRCFVEYTTSEDYVEGETAESYITDGVEISVVGGASAAPLGL